MLTTEQLNAIKERAEKVVNNDWFSDEGEFLLWESLDDITAKDIPALLQTVEALSTILAETEETRDKIAKDWSNLLDERVTLKAKIATYESLAQEFDYGAILDEMACESMRDYEGGDSDD